MILVKSQKFSGNTRTLKISNGQRVIVARRNSFTVKKKHGCDIMVVVGLEDGLVLEAAASNLYTHPPLGFPKDKYNQVIDCLTSPYQH